MRKFILIASMVLVSATAHAGSDRGLRCENADLAAFSQKPVNEVATDKTGAPCD